MNPYQLAKAIQLARKVGKHKLAESYLTHLGLIFALAEIKGNQQLMSCCRQVMKGFEND